jgi:autotransporter family porin
VVWSDLDDFALACNKVNFDDDPAVRGRLGLRVGTSTLAWSGTKMEPCVIGSLWGDLSCSRQATVVSGNTTFNFEDDPEDVCGEAGVNLFNPSANTSHPPFASNLRTQPQNPA